MDLRIRPIGENDIEALAQLSLAAWEPVFRSFEQVLGHAICARVWPDGVASQPTDVEAICRDREKYTVWVAEVDGKAVGFIACALNFQSQVGEVYMLAVDPDYQNHGIGTALNVFALERMKEAGMKLAEVGTGGDPGHAPARRSYEKAGYTGLPLVRYHKEM